MGEVVVVLDMQTTLPISVDRVLDAPEARALKVAILVGVDADGDLYFAGSDSDAAQIVWLFERAKDVLLRNSRSQGGP